MLTGKNRISVVVESGSCSVDYRRWEERAHCGHAHKSFATAARCMAKLTRSYCQHGRIAGLLCRYCLGYAQAQNTSAKWYNARYHNQIGERIGWED